MVSFVIKLCYSSRLQVSFLRDDVDCYVDGSALCSANNFVRMLNASRESCRKVLIKCCPFSVLLLIGETDDVKVKALRSRQMKNFHLGLMVSQV